MYRNLAESEIRLKSLIKRKDENWRLLQRKRKKFWVEPGRCKRWFNNIELGISPESTFKTNFRMSKHNFYLLCYKLRPYIERRVNLESVAQLPQSVKEVPVHPLLTNEQETLGTLM